LIAFASPRFPKTRVFIRRICIIRRSTPKRRHIAAASACNSALPASEFPLQRTSSKTSSRYTCLPAHAIKPSQRAWARHPVRRCVQILPAHAASSLRESLSQFSQQRMVWRDRRRVTFSGVEAGESSTPPAASAWRGWRTRIYCEQWRVAARALPDRRRSAAELGRLPPGTDEPN